MGVGVGVRVGVGVGVVAWAGNIVSVVISKEETVVNGARQAAKSVANKRMVDKTIFVFIKKPPP